MRVLVRWLVKDESGQDLVEWALLIAFVALGSTAYMSQSGDSLSRVWSGANQALQTQSAAQGGSGSGTGGNHERGRHGGHGGTGSRHHHNN